MTVTTGDYPLQATTNSPLNNPIGDYSYSLQNWTAVSRYVLDFELGKLRAELQTEIKSVKIQVLGSVAKILDVDLTEIWGP